MASSSASEAPWEVTKKAKSIASRCSSFWRKDQHDDEVNPQLSSPLFTRLPQELRDRIWQFALEPPENANAAHFHIYDEVYDACTYQPPSDERSRDRAEKRSAQRHIALLLSCRRVYQEATDYLYGNSHFTFVVCAGFPRRHCRKKDSDSRKSLGKLRACETLFRRIRSLTIIVQPGKNPHLQLYHARVQELLRVLDYGKALVSLTLVFNYRLEISGADPTQAKRRHIVAAFYPLQRGLEPRLRAASCRLTIFSWLSEGWAQVGDADEHKYVQLMRTLAGVDRAHCVVVPQSLRESPPSRNLPVMSFHWRPRNVEDRKMLVRFGADQCCLERGALGADEYALTRHQPIPVTPMKVPFFPDKTIPGVSKEGLQCSILVAGYLTLLPLTAPMTLYGVVKRKKMKGEIRARGWL